MAAVIPEAAEAVTTGESAVAGTAAAGRSRAAAGRHRAGPSQAEQQARGQLADSAKGRARKAGRNALSARAPGGRNYQPVILAEFLVAIIVVALAPVARGGTDTAKAKGSPSPYDTNTLKQILLIGVVYFILALLSSGRQLGRASAWFGALVLVAVGVQQTVNGGFAAVLRMFGLNVGGGLGTFPAGGGSGLLPSLNINTGQFSGDALAAGVSVSPPPAITGVQAPPPGVSSTVINQVPDATGNFPVVEPGGTITNSVTTNGLPPSVNLALQDPRLAARDRRGRHHRVQHGKMDRRIHPAGPERVSADPAIRGVQADPDGGRADR